MNNYIISLEAYTYKDKTKVEYFCLPVKVENNTFKSTVSEVVYQNLKLKKFFGKHYFLQSKLTKEYYIFQMVVYSDKDLAAFESEWLPKIKKYTSFKLFFNKRFKEALKKRIDRIIMEEKI